MGLEKLNVLKIDCEGCEVALARDMLREDQIFFITWSDQISIETHVTKTWMTNYYGACVLLWVAACAS